jgi:hypothetical protein
VRLRGRELHYFHPASSVDRILAVSPATYLDGYHFRSDWGTARWQSDSRTIEYQRTDIKAAGEREHSWWSVDIESGESRRGVASRFRAKFDQTRNGAVTLMATVIHLKCSCGNHHSVPVPPCSACRNTEREPEVRTVPDPGPDVVAYATQLVGDHAAGLQIAVQAEYHLRHGLASLPATLDQKKVLLDIVRNLARVWLEQRRGHGVVGTITPD